MDQRIVASIKSSLNDEPSESLRRMFKSGDTSRWSPEAFEAMQQILFERGDSDAESVSQTSSVIAKEPAPALIWWFAILAMPIGFCGLIIFGIRPFKWLPTSCRLAPYTAISGCLVMLLYQKLNQPRVVFSMRAVTLTGILSGVFGIAILLLLLVITSGGLVH